MVKQTSARRASARRKLYVPDRGEIIWFSFDPQAGHEQAGHRPALILSPIDFNRKTGFALVCPVTSSIKGYPFEVALPEGLSTEGVVLSDQVRSLDWGVRKAVYIETAPPDVVEEVVAKIIPILGV